MRDIASFLEDQQTGLIDSTGEFTIAADKALEKLAHSQLPEPSYWILKVVQFATAHGARNMNVSVGRRVTRVEIDLKESISIVQLQKGLDSVSPLPDRALDHLVTGLRALGGIEGRVFALNLIRRDGSELLMWDGSGLSFKQTEGGSTSDKLILEVSLRSSFIWKADLLKINHRAGEVSALTLHAFTSPMPVMLDGRVLSNDHLEKADSFLQPLLWNFEEYDQGMELPYFMKPDADTAIKTSAFWSFSYTYSLKHKILRLAAEPQEEKRVSRIHWIRDGVIVKRDALRPTLPFVTDLFVDCSDCPADLGGLNLRETDAFADKKAWALALLGEISRQVRVQISEMKSLQGKTLGGWDALMTTTSHLPINKTVTYDGPGYVANNLNAHPSFRKKLLRHIKTGVKEWLDVVPRELG